MDSFASDYNVNGIVVLVTYLLIVAAVVVAVAVVWTAHQPTPNK